MNFIKRFWRWLFGKKPGQVAGGVAVPTVKEEQIEVKGAALVETTQPVKLKFVRWPPPRSMTSAEKALYKIKPNLQYWFDKIDEKHTA